MTRTATNKPLLDKTDALISHTELDLYATDEQNDVTLNICQWICSCFYTYISVTTARMKVNNTCCELSCNERQEVKWPQKVNTASCIWKIGWRRSFHTFNQWSRSSSLVWQRAAALPCYGWRRILFVLTCRYVSWLKVACSHGKARIRAMNPLPHKERGSLSLFLWDKYCLSCYFWLNTYDTQAGQVYRLRESVTCSGFNICRQLHSSKVHWTFNYR